MLPEEIGYINEGTKEERLAHLADIIANEKEKPEVLSQYSNNHIHTTFSFSPYSPSAAVWAARNAGLAIAGIMDHDSIGGADEFRKAAEIAGIGVTCGFELRVDISDSPFGDRKINHPDQKGTAYMAIHSVRPEYFDVVQKKMAPLRELRNERNRKMLKNINELFGTTLDFERDVLPLSEYANGGSVTERHLLFALAKKQLDDEWAANGVTLSDGEKSDLYYKRLGILKSDTSKFYVVAKEELMKLDEAVEFANEIDGKFCYAYLGDVTDSPTGDKAAAQYEDAFLPELLQYFKDAGVKNVTYMPARNTKPQAERIIRLCEELELGQISGEDINSPGQSFICKQLSDPMFAHLVGIARGLVEREK